LAYFQLAASFYDDVRDTDLGGASHAGEFETSLMLHLRPKLVREDRIEGTNLVEPYEQGIQDLVVGGPLSTYRPFREYSESGAIGDPSEASAEKGADIYDRLGDELELLLCRMYEHNR
jgi:creatinine amidohydrolase